MSTFRALHGISEGSDYSGLDGTPESVLVGDEAVSEGAGICSHRLGC